MKRAHVAIVVTLALVVAACGEDEGSTSAGEIEAVVEDDVEDDDFVDDDDADLDEADVDDADVDDGDFEDDGFEDEQEFGVGPLELGDATYSDIECPFEIEVEVDVDCGVVEVPESRQGLSDATIEIAIAILRTPAADPEPDPVVYLAGGPGGEALSEHAGFLPEYSFWDVDAFLSTRDVILVDQRGVGFSQPSIFCSEEDVEECYDRLIDEGVAVAAYTTPENAADIESIRLALGLDEWNIYGSSYGTRLGLVVLRNYPQGVRSVVLAGVYPPNKVPAYHDYMGNTLRAIDALSAECRRQAECDDAYGDIDELLLAALDAAESSPSETDAEALFDAMFLAMYGMPSVALIPNALLLASEGFVDEAMEVLEGDDAGFNARRSDSLVSSSDGLFHAVECREEQGFTSLEVLEAQAEEYLQAGYDELLIQVLLSGAAANTESICTFWDMGRSDPGEREPVVSDIPTLLLSGEFDPITPPSWGDLAAETLSRSTHVVVPSQSHSLINVDQCLDDIVISFLGDPASDVDSGCVAGMETIAFVLP